MSEGVPRTTPDGEGFLPVGRPRQVGPQEWQPAPPLPPEATKRNGWAVFWHVIFGLDLVFLGLLVVLNLAFYFLVTTGGEPVPVEGGDPNAMWAEILFSLLIFGIIPLAWIAGTRVAPVEGTIRYLHLHRFWPSVGHGLGYAALLLGLLILTFLVIDILGISLGESPAENRFTGITLPLVFATSAVAAVGEEIFFRGVLQKWIGVWGQAFVFGLFHLPAGPIAFIVTGLIGLLFGFLVKRGRSLWLVITAHFAYDVFLLMGQYISEQVPEETTGMLPWFGF